jgi:hypothetical protein
LPIGRGPAPFRKRSDWTVDPMGDGQAGWHANFCRRASLAGSSRYPIGRPNGGPVRGAAFAKSSLAANRESCPQRRLHITARGPGHQGCESSRAAKNTRVLQPFGSSRWHAVQKRCPTLAPSPSCRRADGRTDPIHWSRRCRNDGDCGKCGRSRELASPAPAPACR